MCVRARLWFLLMLLILVNCDKQSINNESITTDGITDETNSALNVSSNAYCSGDCIHPVAHLVCSQLRNRGCKEKFLRCCLAKVLNIGTVVKTSALLLTDEVTVSTSNGAPGDSLSLESRIDISPSAVDMNVRCPGICIQSEFLRFCKNVIDNGYCNHGKTCCATNNNEELSASMISETITSPPELQCHGTCVAPLFSSLCDNISSVYHCPSGGHCCINQFPSTSTTTASAGPCLGTCIPTFLSGVCNKPAELVVRTTDCASGTICCITHNQEDQAVFESLTGHLTTPLFEGSLPPIGTQFNEPEKRPISSSEHPPLCPGPCLSRFLKFACFGNNAIYSGFRCLKEGHVCCAPLAEINRYEQALQSSNGSLTLGNFSVADQDNQPHVCGIKGEGEREGRVVGGFDSEAGEWCWQVALINAQNQYLCGGALIGPQWVLTAAHCITNIVRKGDSLYVRAGDLNLASQYGSPGAQTQRVSTNYIHHNHNSQTLDNDIALLKLEMTMELENGVCLVCLPRRDGVGIPGTKCTVTGYGFNGEAGPIALKIREAEVPIVAEQECTVKINTVTENLFILPASSFCAGGEKGNDACQGDGGGPLVCEMDGYYELTGLVSWGFGCGQEGVPGVYVKVSAFIGWINQIISVNNL
ncbi:uncharacterized protein LOC143255172 [Tachypleus tridentatus]|uniref:uncharacterized protein LOC143255172 n=1 Tax=Tachypleus tridentatus TaxID=6853 RepID=UPI003FD4FC89